ncbi:site-specific tyrosine recombinase/integron integrase [Collinsella sp. LCP19S3_C1]|uniref:site-specific tyrosine recombinase/integron integrase n=1 Tax=Collinsella sp. LCP19S3_C1 TaxID=3438758 RepID=UPI003F8DDA39
MKEKVDYNEANFDTYVSTESLLPGKKGRQAPSSLPQTGKVTVYKAGDILVSNIRPYFKKIWYADRTGTCSGDVLVFRSKQPEQSGYLYSCMRSDAFFDYIMKGAKGTKMPRGDKKQMLTYKVASNPSGATVDFIESALSQASSSSKEKHRLAALRDVLLPKLMSGEIDVSKVDLKQLNSHLLHYVQRVVHTVAIVLDERSSVETVINAVLSEMQSLLDPHQLKHLAIALRRALGPKQAEPGQDLLALFLTAKEVEGCSPKTIAYYEATLQHMNTALAKPYTQVESDDLRRYLNDYEVKRGSSKVTIDNIRRIMSSFYSWLEDEDYIVKSPVRRIRRVKTAQVAKEVLSDEELEVLRDACESKRDLAIVDLLASTGMRIGELVRLDRKDVNLHERECLVMGKGNKQRPVYFDARAKLHLTEYLSSRVDKSPALFVALDSSARRITVGSIELRLRDLGRSAGINRVHPHKFRRTLATHAIDKGMPIEQVQKLLGHAKIDTTMHYAMVNQNNVKASHRKYLE